MIEKIQGITIGIAGTIFLHFALWLNLKSEESGFSTVLLVVGVGAFIAGLLFTHIWPENRAYIRTAEPAIFTGLASVVLVMVARLAF